MTAKEQRRAQAKAWLAGKIGENRETLWKYLSQELDAVALEGQLDDIFYIAVEALPEELLNVAEDLLERGDYPPMAEDLLARGEY